MIDLKELEYLIADSITEITDTTDTIDENPKKHPGLVDILERLHIFYNNHFSK